MTERPDTIEIQVWKREGGMMTRCDALDIEDPLHPYNQIVAKGLKPEDYGIRHPYEEEFGEKSRGELISEIIKLRKEVEGYARASVMWR